MNIIFDFHPAIKTNLQTITKEKVEEDLDTNEISPCHAGSLRVFVMPADHPLNVGIKGDVQCTCGKTARSFSGSDDGSSLRWRGVDL